MDQSINLFPMIVTVVGMVVAFIVAIYMILLLLLGTLKLVNYMLRDNANMASVANILCIVLLATQGIDLAIALIAIHSHILVALGDLCCAAGMCIILQWAMRRLLK